MRIGRLSGFLVLIAALPRVLLAAGEPPTPAPISVEPAVLLAPPSTASVSGSVVITVPQENQVRLRAMPAVEGDALAPITFPFSKDSDGKPRDWMDVALSNGAARVAFSVAPPPEAGLYRGSIQAFRADDTLLATAESNRATSKLGVFGSSERHSPKGRAAGGAGIGEGGRYRVHG